MATLEEAWKRHPQASQTGRLQARATERAAGMTELVVIPLLVSVTANIVTDLVKDIVDEWLDRREGDDISVTAEEQDDGSHAVILEPTRPQEPE